MRNSLPFTWIVDPDGNVVCYSTGIVFGTMIDDAIKELISGEGSSSTDSPTIAPSGDTGYDAVLKYNQSIFDNQNSSQRMMEYLLAPGDDIYWYSVDEDIRNEAKRIISDCTTDMQKLRAIHDWICTNLYYDNYGVSRNSSGVGPRYVYANRGTRCEGFADMTAALCREADIPCKIVEGYSGLEKINITGQNIESIKTKVMSSGSAHAWNEAWVGGRWVLMDNTFDCNNSNTTTTTTVSYNDKTDTYFDMDLKAFSKTHLFNSNISSIEENLVSGIGILRK